MNAYKICGLTMKQFLEEINSKSEIKYTYTTRLDPMAKGLVQLIEEKEFKNLKNYLNSDKKYQVRILFGIQTDSDDVLGKITGLDLLPFNNKNNLSKYFPYFEKLEQKDFYQKYHYFSSKRIQWRRNHKDIEKDIPSHLVSLYFSKIINHGLINFQEWKKEMIEELELVDKSQNFRQDEIIKQWKELEDITFLNFIDLELKVSSGFFVRQFIRDISEELNIPLLTYHITRISIE
jgi:tRNA U55 pseudouridine synthase TruB